MLNSGKELENFVQIVEKSLLPQGFTIDVRQLEYDEEGNRIAELDIIVSGKIGPTKIKYLIECRDRPSVGPAPNSWIEQLVGRRERFKFDKVIAVSSTGFAPGSYEYAKEKGIELRTLSEIRANDIYDWFKAQNIALIVAKFDLKAVRLIKISANEDQIKELTELLITINADSKIFFLAKSGKNYRGLDLWNKAHLKCQSLADDIKIDSPPIRKRVIVNYSNPDHKYSIKLSEGYVYIDRIEFVVDITKRVKLVPISRATQYGIEPDMISIAQSVHFNLQYGDNDFDLALHRVKDEDRSKLFVTIVDLKEKQAEN